MVVNDRALYPIAQDLKVIGKPCPVLHEVVEPAPQLSHISISLARPQQLLSMATLSSLFIQGKVDFVLKLLVKVHAAISKEKDLVQFTLSNQQAKSAGAAVRKSSLLDLFRVSLEEVLAEIGEHVAAQVV